MNPSIRDAPKLREPFETEVGRFVRYRTWSSAPLLEASILAREAGLEVLDVASVVLQAEGERIVELRIR